MNRTGYLTERGLKYYDFGIRFPTNTTCHEGHYDCVTLKLKGCSPTSPRDIPSPNPLPQKSIIYQIPHAGEGAD